MAGSFPAQPKAKPTAIQLAGSIINEIGSPIGCAFLIFIGQLVTHNFNIYKTHQSMPPKPPSD